MISIDIKLNLPDDLAREAADRGLLTAEALQQLLDTEVARRRKLDQLAMTMDRLAALDLPPLSDKDLNAEIKAARAERRARRARSA
jgi:hypothetical protein